MEVIPTLKGKHIDAVIYSPPYNHLEPDRTNLGMFKTSWWLKDKITYSDRVMPEEEYQEWQAKVLKMCLEISPIVWVNHKTRYRGGAAIHPLHFLKGPFYAEVVWDRMGSMQLNSGRFALSHEYWLAFGKPRYWNNKVNKRMSVWKIRPGGEKESDNLHPCPYPVSFVTPIIEACVLDGAVVDPFMGSGTTGVACVLLGKKFVGIEVVEEYFEYAIRRIRNAYARRESGGNLFLSKSGKRE